MRLYCGPVDDQRLMSLSFPAESKKIGAFVSGGIDSAIMYYLLHLENLNNGSTREIVPFVMLRKDGSRYFPKLVVDYIHDSLGIKKVSPTIVGDNLLPEHQQLKSGVIHAVLEYNIDVVYLGSIKRLPEHVKEFTYEGNHPETRNFKTPFVHFYKTHIVDLVCRYEQEFLFNITHACLTYEVGRCNYCTGCLERQWAFDQLGHVDPGNI